MSVSLLIISHGQIGHTLLQAAFSIWPHPDLHCHCLAIEHKDEVEQRQQDAERIVRSLDKGDGVLVLTDLCGATPGRIAESLVLKHHVRVVGGVNLPMIMHIFNFPNSDLDEITESIQQAGQSSVFSMPSVKQSFCHG